MKYPSEYITGNSVLYEEYYIREANRARGAAVCLIRPRDIALFPKVRGYTDTLTGF